MLEIVRERNYKFEQDPEKVSVKKFLFSKKLFIFTKQGNPLYFFRWVLPDLKKLSLEVFYKLDVLTECPPPPQEKRGWTGWTGNKKVTLVANFLGRGQSLLFSDLLEHWFNNKQILMWFKNGYILNYGLFRLLLVESLVISQRAYL